MSKCKVVFSYTKKNEDETEENEFITLNLKEGFNENDEDLTLEKLIQNIDESSLEAWNNLASLVNLQFEDKRPFTDEMLSKWNEDLRKKFGKLKFRLIGTDTIENSISSMPLFEHFSEVLNEVDPYWKKRNVIITNNNSIKGVYGYAHLKGENKEELEVVGSKYVKSYILFKIISEKVKLKKIKLSLEQIEKAITAYKENVTQSIVDSLSDEDILDYLAENKEEYERIKKIPKSKRSDEDLSFIETYKLKLKLSKSTLSDATKEVKFFEKELDKFIDDIKNDKGKIDIDKLLRYYFFNSEKKSLIRTFLPDIDTLIYTSLLDSGIYSLKEINPNVIKFQKLISKGNLYNTLTKSDFDNLIEEINNSENLNLQTILDLLSYVNDRGNSYYTLFHSSDSKFIFRCIGRENMETKKKAIASLALVEPIKGGYYGEQTIPMFNYRGNAVVALVTDSGLKYYYNDLSTCNVSEFLVKSKSAFTELTVKLFIDLKYYLASLKLDLQTLRLLFKQISDTSKPFTVEGKRAFSKGEQIKVLDINLSLYEISDLARAKFNNLVTLSKGGYANIRSFDTLLEESEFWLKIQEVLGLPYLTMFDSEEKVQTFNYYLAYLFDEGLTIDNIDEYKDKIVLFALKVANADELVFLCEGSTVKDDVFKIKISYLDSNKTSLISVVIPELNFSESPDSVEIDNDKVIFRFGDKKYSYSLPDLKVFNDNVVTDQKPKSVIYIDKGKSKEIYKFRPVTLELETDNKEKLHIAPLMNSLLKHLQSHFGLKINLYTTREIELNPNLNKIEGITRKKAFIFNGEICINLNNAKPNDLVHEFMHLILGQIRSVNPKLYYDIVNKSVSDADVISMQLSDPRPASDIKEELFVIKFSTHMSKYLPILNSTVDSISNLTSIFNNAVNKTFMLKSDSISGLDDVANMTLELLFDTFGSYMLVSEDKTIKDFIHDESGLTQRKITNIISDLKKQDFIKEVIGPDGKITYVEYEEVLKEVEKTDKKTGEIKTTKKYEKAETPIAEYSEELLRDKISKHILAVQEFIKNKNTEKPKLVLSERESIVNKYNDLLNFSDIVFSDDNVASLRLETIAKLKLYQTHTVSTSKGAIDNMENLLIQDITLNSNYISLYSYLDLVNENGEHYIVPFNLERLMKIKHDELLKKGVPEEQIKILLAAELLGYILTAKSAYDIHKAANIFFKKPGLSKSSFYNLLSSTVTEDGETYDFEQFHSDKGVIDSLYDSLCIIKLKINEMFPDCDIIPNILLISKTVDSSKKLVANVDLIVVEKSGKINVLKFKASNKLYGNLDSKVLERDDYHLGFIRLMLAEKGFPASDIGLYTIGLNMSRDAMGNLNSVSFEKIDNRLSQLNVDGLYNRLAWRSGTYAKKINKKIAISLADSQVTVPFKDDVVKCITKAFPNVIMNVLESEITVDEFIKSKRIMKSDDPNYTYMFIDTTKERSDSSRKVYIKSSEEKLINAELRLKVKELLARLKSSRKDTIEMTVDNLLKAFDGELPLLSALPLNLDAQQRLEIAFSKYLDGEWEFVKDDMLSEFGLYFILNKLTGQVDIINFTNFNGELNETIHLGLSDWITGTFLKDYQGFDKSKKLLRATRGNVELMKTMFILNQPQVAAKLNGTFKIGQIRVINPITGLSTIADNSTIVSSFNVIKNELISSGIEIPDGLLQIQFMSPYELFRQNVYALMNIDGSNLQLDSIYATLERVHPVTLAEMEKELLKIEELMRTNSDWKFLNRRPEEIVQSNDKISLLYVLLWKCIWLCRGDFSQIRDLSKYSGTLKDKTLFNGTMVNMPGTEVDRNHQQATVIARKAMDRITKRLTEWYHPYRNTIVSDLWKAKGYTPALNAIIGNQTHLYSNMFVRDANGKINENLLLKDPSDPTLSPGEKKFLEDFLWLVNSIRFKLTSKSDPKIAELKADKSWYWLPLVKADFSSRIQQDATTRVTKSIRRLSSELKAFKATGMDDLIYTEDTKNTVGQGIVDYKMFNLFTLSESSIEARNDLITAADDPGYWELNLETVLTKYMFAHIRKEEFDRTLPLIKGLRILGLSYFLNAGYLNPDKLKEQSRIFDDFLKDYMEVSIYNKSILNDETRYLSKFTSKVKFYASTIALGFNFVGGIRECLEGAWKTVGRILSQWYSVDKRFTKLDWLKAVGMIIVDAPDFIQRVTLFEAICQRYRIANIDMNALADRIKSNKSGIMNARDRMLFWFQTSPDYFTRMGMLLAQMIHEGVFEALGYDQNGLTYDWKKDKRFSDYAKGSGPNYHKQRGEFLSRIAQYNADHGTELTEKDGLPEPYTLAEILSLKLFSDMTFGAYDHDTKMLVEKIFLGSLVFLFKTYLSATKTMYFLSPGLYNQGEREQATSDKGEPLYWHKTEDGKNYVSTEVSESPYTWNTDSFMKGIFWTLLDVYNEFKEHGMSAITSRWNDDRTFKANIIQFSYNMLVWLALGALITYLIRLWATHRKEDSIGEPITFNKIMKDEAFNVMLKAVIGSFTDFNILNSFVGNITEAEPASIAILNNFFTSTGEFLFGDKSLKYWFRTNSGLYRSLQGVGDNIYELIKLQQAD